MESVSSRRAPTTTSANVPQDIQVQNTSSALKQTVPVYFRQTLRVLDEFELHPQHLLRGTGTFENKTGG
jgi:hypothetical protein